MEELTWPRRRRLWLRLGLRLGLWGVGGVFVWRVLPRLVGAFWPFLGAAALAAALNRPVGFLRRRLGLRRGAASAMLVALVAAAVGGAVVGLGYLLVSQAAAALEDWPALWSGVAAGMERVSRSVAELAPPVGRPSAGGALAALEEWLGQTLGGLLSGAVGLAGELVLALPGLLFGAVILVMAACCLCADYPCLRAQAVRCLPRECRGFLAGVKGVAVDAFGGWLRAEFLLSSMVFAVLLAGFLLTGEPYAVLLAFGLGVLDFIPVAGAGTGLAPWAAVELLRGSYAHAAVLGALWGATALLRHLAEPRVVGGQTGLSPIASLASLYVGLKLAGVAGMILGPMVWVILRAVARGGAFDNTLRDLRLAFGDLAAVLRGRA